MGSTEGHSFNTVPVQLAGAGSEARDAIVRKAEVLSSILSISMAVSQLLANYDQKGGFTR